MRGNHANSDFGIGGYGVAERETRCNDFSSLKPADPPWSPTMSENLILNWTQSLTAADRDLSP